MVNSQSTLAPRPSLGHRSISEQAPLYNPSSAPQSGSRLRASKAVSGAHTATGSQLPYSPLLPLPPASATTSKLGLQHAALVDPEQIENAEPSFLHGQHGGPHSPSALAARRLARRGISETFPSHSHQALKSNRSAAAASSAFPALSPKIALRLDIAAASDLSGKPAASKSAGMIRSYSLPVATQAEHDEQQRIMALGLSPASRHPANPSWWQYGWPSPGGINHRHVHHPSPAVPEFVGQRRRSSQSKLCSVMTPIPDAAVESSPPRPSSRSSKTRSSCSPKMKSKHLPSIHQHSFEKSSSRSASSSPKTVRSPLSMISVNLPALDQQLEQSYSLDDEEEDDDDKSVADSVAATPAEAAFDIEMDALNQRFAEWSRSQALATPSARTHNANVAAQQQDDYFNLVHDDDVDPSKNFLGVGSDTSDEARTPRASSPRPLSKAALYHHDEQQFQSNRWEGSLDFIHPDHLA